MSFFEYLDRKFTNLTVELKDEYDQFKKSEQNAIHTLLEWERFIYKWFLIPRLLIEYVLVKLGLKKMPDDKMAELKAKWKAEQTAKNGDKAKDELSTTSSPVVPEVKT